MLRVAVMVSGGGTNLQAIIDELTKLLATVDDNNPVVLNINE